MGIRLQTKGLESFRHLNLDYVSMSEYIYIYIYKTTKHFGHVQIFTKMANNISIPMTKCTRVNVQVELRIDFHDCIL